jgi:hypothetical protein
MSSADVDHPCTVNPKMAAAPVPGDPGRPHLKGEVPMSVAVGLNKALDKAYENSSLSKVLDAPVSALAGVSDGDAEKLGAAFNIKTVRDLGTNKYFKLAEALVDVAAQAD